MSGESLEKPAEVVERFSPTGGRVSGVLAVVLAVATAVLGAVGSDDVVPSFVAGGALGAVLAWAALLRPRVAAGPTTLYLRNMFETVEVPLAAIDQLIVRQVLAVRVGDRKFVSPAVGRKLRKVLGHPGRGQGGFGPNVAEKVPDEFGSATGTPRAATEIDYVDHVEQRLRDLIGEAQQRQGVSAYSDESMALAADVRRRPAWPEIGAVVVLGVAFVVTLLA